MKEIILSQGKVALVDDEDYERVNKLRWCARRCKHLFYAHKNMLINGKDKTILMHRFILGIVDGKIWIDHKDRDGLNNTRSNLRICTPAQNRANANKVKKGTSKYKGVVLHKRDQIWEAYIRFNNKLIYLGRYSVESEGAKAYNKKAKELFGEFARLNIIPEKPTEQPLEEL